jgi:hypothetical protein
MIHIKEDTFLNKCTARSKIVKDGSILVVFILHAKCLVGDIHYVNPWRMFTKTGIFLSMNRFINASVH